MIVYLIEYLFCFRLYYDGRVRDPKRETFSACPDTTLQDIGTKGIYNSILR